MKQPAALVNLATEIVRCWQSKRSNYIVVAPPFSEPHRLFQLLEDVEFQRQVIGQNAENLAVAKVRQLDFKNHTRLVNAVLHGWGLVRDIVIDTQAPLTALESAIELLRIRRFEPIILVDRFHDAIKWLDGDFGVTLRDLENEHFLKTVVAVPVTLDELRRRELAAPNGSLFLQSDWGQGHRQKTLQGYSESEVATLLEERRVGEDIASRIFFATAGLPGLVDVLIEEVEGKDLFALDSFMKAESARRCSRLLEWLDAPNEDIYQRIVVESLYETRPRVRGTTLDDHSWSKVFLRRDGRFTCLMLGWAALDRLSRQRSRDYIDLISDHANNHRFRDIETLLPVTSGGGEFDGEIWRAVRAVNRFCIATDVYQDKWAESSKCLVELGRIESQTTNVVVKDVMARLSQWAPLIDLMCEYFARQKSGKQLKLEEFVCQRKDEDAFSAYVQLQLFRLSTADKLAPLPAMKSVIEQPESFLQVYSCFKFDVKFWNFGGLDGDMARRVEKLFGRPFDVPSKGQRLGFHELLWLSLAYGDCEGVDRPLFETATDVHALEAQYRARCDQVHSTSFVSIADWISYRQACLELSGSVARSILGSEGVVPLRDPAHCICALVATLKAEPTSS